MPLPSYASLKKKNAQLVRDIGELRQDPEYGITPRNALAYELEQVIDDVAYLVLVEVENFQAENRKHGRNGLNILIARAVRAVRDPDVLVRARWLHANQILVFLRGEAEDAQELQRRLYTSFRSNKLRIVNAAVPFTGSVCDDARLAESVCQAHREGRDV
jgi:hypothetical protein